MNHKTKIVGFHKPEEEYGIFSNWYPAGFTFRGQRYCCVEQYMMSRKVLLAGRYDLNEMIMKTEDPEEIKKYAGPEYFTDYAKIQHIWEAVRYDAVKFAVRQKCLQNPEVMDALLQTGNALLAECAGRDRVWGIGINLHDHKWKDVSNWKGDNLLGRILMELRMEFRIEMKIFGFIDHKQYTDTEGIAEGKMTAGVLNRIPQYHHAIASYAAQLNTYEKKAFLAGTLDDWDKNFNTGGIPRTGFFEMKEEIYRISRLMSYSD